MKRASNTEEVTRRAAHSPYAPGGETNQWKPGVKSTSNRKPKPATRSQKARPHRVPGSIPFPQARGKTLADIYLTSDADLNCITLSFDDKTELLFDIVPCLTIQAEYSDWKTGDQRVLKRWPRMRSERVFRASD